jgi:citrate lyase beta subunit
MRTLATARSLLFVPGDDEARLAQALDAGADVVVADLEDAVLEPGKAAAREAVGRAFSAARGPALRAVRVNGAGTPFFAGDVELARSLELDALVLPKATPEAVAALPDLAVPVLALVETAQGLRLAYETAAAAGVEALVLGALDLGLELGLEPRPDRQEILFARSQLVRDAAAAGLRAPFDLVHVDPADAAGLEEECAYARSLGFRGKACVHPAQVEVVNRVFARSPEVPAGPDAKRRLFQA